MWENNYYLPACLKGGLHVGRTGVSFLKGTGGLAEELEGHGTPFQDRGRRKNEMYLSEKSGMHSLERQRAERRGG